MPPLSLAEPTGRYLSFSEREELALLKAQGLGVRAMARELKRDPGTISRELRRMGCSVWQKASLKVSPMALTMLKPRLQAINVNRVKVLDTKAGTTPRIRGDAWMAIRRKVLLRDGYRCCDCGRVHASNQIDHDKPLEQAGTNDMSNLKVRCVECHAVKTKREAQGRARGY